MKVFSGLSFEAHALEILCNEEVGENLRGHPGRSCTACLRPGETRTFAVTAGLQFSKPTPGPGRPLSWSDKGGMRPCSAFLIRAE